MRADGHVQKLVAADLRRLTSELRTQNPKRGAFSRSLLRSAATSLVETLQFAQPVEPVPRGRGRIDADDGCVRRVREGNL